MKPISLFYLMLIFPLHSWAQDFELDLSEEKAPEVPKELRPSIAMLSVLALDADELTKGRAQLLETEMSKTLLQSEIFGTTIEPSGATKTLGGADDATSCSTYSCFESSCKKLKSNRAFRLTVSKSGSGSVVQFVGFDPSLSALVTHEYDSQEKIEKTFIGIAGKTQAQKDKEFVKKAVTALSASLKKLGTPNGKLNIDNVDQSAQVTIDGVPAGTGSFESVVQRGTHEIKVLADGYLPFVVSISVEPLVTKTVQVSLVAKPVERAMTVKKEEPSGTPIYTRPGLYVAIAGAVVAALGLGFGQMAKGVEAKIAAGGDPVSVTRTEAKSAQSNATVANVLVGTGSAMIAGGVIWMLVTPSLTPTATGASEPSPVGPGVSVHFGGRF